ncbi:hypothetical protein, partial [Burkholderia cenocepacia]|uniref:hypothetical protein n=1 Tax=Burkholderia cenocepacia TaxID=95486 RepID=UPI002237CEC9
MDAAVAAWAERGLTIFSEDFLCWRSPSIVIRLCGLRALAPEISDAVAGRNAGIREALAHSRRKSALCALYRADGRLDSDPHRTVSPPAAQTDHFHLPRPRLFSTMSNA